MKLAEYLKHVDVDMEQDTKDLVIKNSFYADQLERLRKENAYLNARERQIHEIKAKEIEKKVVEPLREELKKEEFKADFYEHAYDDLYVFIKSKLYQQFRMPFMSLSSTIVESIRNYIEHNHYEFDEYKYWSGGYDNYDDDDDEVVHDCDDEGPDDVDCSNCPDYVGNGGTCKGE